MLLAAHIATGVLSLVLGPIAFVKERQPPFRSGAGLAYTCAVVTVGLTAVALVARRPDELWWLAPLGVFAAGLALLGRAAPGWKTPGWARAYAHGQGGSYIALVTASLVVSLEGPAQVAAWIAPTLIGLVLIERRVRRLSRRQPRQFPRAAQRPRS